MKLKRILTLTTVAVLSQCAHAHFLWAEIRETPTRHVAIELAEAPGDSVVGAVNGKSERVKAVPTKLKYQLQGEAFGGPLAAGDKAVGAAMEYGYLERGGVAFKLSYFAKAVQTTGAAASKLNLQAELLGKVSGNDLIVTAYFEGKPAVDAEVTFHLPKAEEVKGKTDAQGNFTIPGGANKPVAVMARVERKQKGTIDGKDYDLARYYTTLTVGRFSEDTKTDQAAFDALKSATDNREKFPEKLLGFQMEIEANVNGKQVTGSFSFDLGAGVIAKLEGDDESKKWVEGQIRSIILHRSAGRFEDGDGANELNFTGSENVLGKQISVKDSTKTKYRVKEGQILEVDRTMGPTRLLVSVLDSIDTTAGRKLATQMAVTTFDANSGTLKSSTLITDAFATTDGVWLPTRRRVVVNEKDGALIRTIEFKAARLVLK